MICTTVDQVIDALQHIVDDSIAKGDRLGYFAALYKQMTVAIREAIRGGRFDDAARMEALDVAFANRYLGAREQYFAGELNGATWLQAYDAATKADHTILQQLLASINPHIMIDLGVAAARTCPGNQLQPLEKDFDRINAILASLEPVIDKDIDKQSPVTRWDERLFGATVKNAAITTAMEVGRVAAWNLATRLAALPLDRQAFVIGARDREAWVMGEAILTNGVFSTITQAWESKDVGQNIRVLAGEGIA